MRRRITLVDVAGKAGVHISTAARAMKSDPRLKPETIVQVQRIAKEIGYEVDPMLAALSVYRTTQRPDRHQGTIAWVTNYPTREGWNNEVFRLYREGAVEALKRHGYKLEDFWLREPGVTARRASQILHNRGIRGLLICPLPVSHGHLSLEWRHFTTVAFGYTLFRPEFTFVTAAHYHNIQTCFRKLHLTGSHQIGLILPKLMDDRMHKIWTAAYYASMTESNRKKAPPIFYIRGEESQKKAFLKWFAAHRPDAIISFWSVYMEYLREIGIRVPEDVSFVHPALQESSREMTGIIEASVEIGRAGANYLVSMLQRGEYGVPAMPHQILLKGAWNPGRTAKKAAFATVA
jgi:DNA-binding LacI/PurR family transcriptional regulator